MGRYLFLIFVCVPLSAFVSHPFDGAMRLDSDLRYVDDDKMYLYLGSSAEQTYNFFKQLYQTKRPTINTERKNSIPKIIHQIWIGKSFPKEFYLFQESCKRLHPDWEYRLWTQDDLYRLQLTNKAFIKESRNPGEISDLLRYEILYQFGGVYLDCDIECLLALDELNDMYDLYVGLQPLDTGYVQLGIGVLGACPKHPIIKAAIDGIVCTWRKDEYKHMATVRTGPMYFTKKFIEYHRDSEKNIALPSFYFYPLGSIAFDVNKKLWQKVGAYTVHHWAKSWLLPTFRRASFQSIQNY